MKTEKMCFFQRYILPLKNWTDRISTRREKYATISKMYAFLRKRAEKLKNVLLFHSMTAYHNFALKTENSWVERVVKPILDTRNTTDVIIYLVYSFTEKSLRKMQCKKE